MPSSRPTGALSARRRAQGHSPRLPTSRHRSRLPPCTFALPRVCAPGTIARQCRWAFAPLLVACPPEETGGPRGGTARWLPGAAWRRKSVPCTRCRTPYIDAHRPGLQLSWGAREAAACYIRSSSCCQALLYARATHQAVISFYLCARPSANPSRSRSSPSSCMPMLRLDPQ